MYNFEASQGFSACTQKFDCVPYSTGDMEPKLKPVMTYVIQY